MAAVTIKHVTKTFGESQVIREFNEEIRDGEFITFLGPSGCGKTTMLRIIAGFEKQTSGEVYIDGNLVSGGRTFVPPEKRGIGMVFQNYAVWPHMTVFENVAYPLTLKKITKEETAKRVDKALELVHLTRHRDHLPGRLSGGQQQRVALARALVAEPKLLLLDEPLSNLDAKLRESMRFELGRIQHELGITVIYVTHDQTEAMAMSDRIFVLNRGVIQQVGSPEEIYNRPVNQFVADFLGKVDFFKGEAKDGCIVFPGMDGQSVPYSGPLRGNVDVAIRPENLYFSEDGPISGTIESQFYLGDVNDCRVRAGKTLIRVIADGFDYKKRKEGENVRLGVRGLMVFEDDGSLDEMLQIMT